MDRLTLLISRSIKIKIVILVATILFLSQVASFIVTYTNIKQSQDRNIADSFNRTQKLFETFVKNQKNVLYNQAHLIGALPILVAVVNSEDKVTIKDTIHEYKKDLSLELIDVFDHDNNYLAGHQEVSEEFKKDLGKEFASKAISGERISGFLLRDNKLIIAAASTVGSTQSPSGSLLVGTSVDSNFSNNIKKLTNSDVSFIARNKIVSSSLSIENQKIMMSKLTSLDNDQELKSFNSDDFLMKVYPIKNIRGEEIGHMILQVSLESSKMFFKKLILFMLAIIALVFVFFMFVGIRFSKSISSPLIKLKDVAHDIETSLDYSIRAPEKGNDEVYRLSTVFNRLLDEIQKNHRDMEEYNKNLERKIDERTKELTQSKNRIASVLNNLDNGFMVFGKDGIIEKGSSKAAISLFGKSPEGLPFFEVLLETNDEERTKVMGWIDLMYQDSMLGFESLALIGPKVFTKLNERYIQLEYKPIYKDDSKNIEKIICISSDKTQEQHLKKIAEQQQATVKRVMLILDDKEAFIDFSNECKDMIEKLNKHLEQDPNTVNIDYLLRYLHTVKGGCSSYHFKLTADIAHQLENSLIDLKPLPISEFVNKLTKIKNQMVNIEKEFYNTLDTHQDILYETSSTSANSKSVSINKINDYYSKLKQKISIDNPLLINEFENNFLLDDLAQSFKRYEKVIKKIAFDQNKEAKLHIKPSNVYVNMTPYKPLLSSCIHAFRNAIDHGIEDKQTREVNSKEITGNIQVQCLKKENNALIVIEDDGKGIDPDNIRDLLVKKGLKDFEQASNISDREVIQSIFNPSFSTKEEVTDLSGRGVGLNAIKYEANKLGGSVFVESRPKQGSRIIIKVPLILIKDLTKQNKDIY